MVSSYLSVCIMAPHRLVDYILRITGSYLKHLHQYENEQKESCLLMMNYELLKLVSLVKQ